MALQAGSYCTSCWLHTAADADRRRRLVPAAVRCASLSLLRREARPFSHVAFSNTASSHAVLTAAAFTRRQPRAGSRREVATGVRVGGCVQLANPQRCGVILCD